MLALSFGAGPSVTRLGAEARRRRCGGSIIAIMVILSIDFGLTPVETSQWGGLLVTLVVAVTGIVVSLPLGILLALGRRSNMPAVRLFSSSSSNVARRAADHRAVHGVGHAAAVPAGGRQLRQAAARLIGVALFSSAYMAEVVRGGLQAIPKGQYEAARCARPQLLADDGADRPAAGAEDRDPGIVNTFIGLFKDTTLVSIIGMFDLLGIVQSGFQRPEMGVAADRRRPAISPPP